MLWFPTAVHAGDIPDASAPELKAKFHRRMYVTGRVEDVRVPRKDALAVRVRVNEREVLLWRFGATVVATRVSCPHQGADLALGDIEEIHTGFAAGALCVRCPAHKWTFAVSGNEHVAGRCLSHPDAQVGVLDTFPVRVEAESGLVSVGFDALAPSVFAPPDF